MICGFVHAVSPKGPLERGTALGWDTAAFIILQTWESEFRADDRLGKLRKDSVPLIGASQQRERRENGFSRKTERGFRTAGGCRLCGMTACN